MMLPRAVIEVAMSIAQGKTLARGKRYGDRVGAEEGLAGPFGRHGRLAVGRRQEDHVFCGGPVAVVRQGAEVLRAADRGRRHPILPGQRDQPPKRLHGLRLPQPVAGVDRQHGRQSLLHVQFGTRIDQPFLDSADVDFQPRDAVGGNAVQVGVDQ